MFWWSGLAIAYADVMQIDLGYTPHGLRVRLVRGVDFTSALRRKTGEWPDGAALWLRSATGDWHAEIDANYALWDVPDTQVAAFLEQERRSMRLWYSDADTDPLIWAIGKAEEIR